MTRRAPSRFIKAGGYNDAGSDGGRGTATASLPYFVADWGEDP
jgi:hypothetical protein